MWFLVKMKKLIKILALILIAALVASIGLYFIYPDVSKLRKVSPKKTAFMEYREKEWQSQGKKKKIIQQWVPLAQIPAVRDKGSDHRGRR